MPTSTEQPTFEELRSFLNHFTEKYARLKGLKPEHHPIHVLDDVVKRSPRRAMQGLRMAVNDCLEQTAHWPLKQVCMLDFELIALNIITLSELRRRCSRRYGAILKRGKIRSEVEYYLIKGIAMAASTEPAAANQLSRMLDSYEQAQLEKRVRGRRRPE